MHQRQRKDGAAIQGIVNEVDPLSSTNISGDRGGFWPKIRHFDITIDLFLW